MKTDSISSLNSKLNKWAGTEGENYANDISACFKWLVPKVDQLTIIVWGNIQMYAMVYRDEHDRLGYESEDKNKTPALALCRAVEQMIDSEEKVS